MLSPRQRRSPDIEGTLLRTTGKTLRRMEADELMQRCTGKPFVHPTWSGGGETAARRP